MNCPKCGVAHPKEVKVSVEEIEKFFMNRLSRPIVKDGEITAVAICTLDDIKELISELKLSIGTEKKVKFPEKKETNVFEVPNTYNSGFNDGIDACITAYNQAEGEK